MLGAMLIALIAIDLVTSRDDAPQLAAQVTTAIPVASTVSNQLGDLGGASTTADTDASITGADLSIAPEPTPSDGPNWIRFAEISLALVFGWIAVTAYGWRGMGGSR